MILGPRVCGVALIGISSYQDGDGKRPREKEPSKEQKGDNDSESSDSESESRESESESTASDLDSTLAPKGSTRLERRKLLFKNYLEGKARQAHNISAEVRASFEESQPGPSQERRMSPHSVTMMFASAMHQSCKLKKRKKINPHPKRPHFDHYLT